MKLLRANTAVDVLLGPFVDDSDGNTDETGLTITQADVRLSKNGQNMAQKNDANACTHDELGYYNCPLDATDTNTEGQLDIIVHESGALQVKMECMVLAEAAYDSLFTAKDDGFMDVNIKTVGRADTQETEADNLESACSNYSVTRGLTGTALPAAAADAAGGLPISDAGGLDLDTLLSRLTANVATEAKQDVIDGIVDTIVSRIVGTIAAGTHNAQSGDSYARLGAPAGASVSADVAAIKAETANIIIDTNELQTDWTNGGRLDLLIDAIKAVTDWLDAKKPSKDYLTATNNADGDIEADEMTGDIPATLDQDTIDEIIEGVSDGIVTDTFGAEMEGLLLTYLPVFRS